MVGISKKAVRKKEKKEKKEEKVVKISLYRRQSIVVVVAVFPIWYLRELDR